MNFEAMPSENTSSKKEPGEKKKTKNRLLKSTAIALGIAIGSSMHAGEAKASGHNIESESGPAREMIDNNLAKSTKVLENVNHYDEINAKVDLQIIRHGKNLDPNSVIPIKKVGPNIMIGETLIPIQNTYVIIGQDHANNKIGVNVGHYKEGCGMSPYCMISKDLYTFDNEGKLIEHNHNSDPLKGTR